MSVRRMINLLNGWEPVKVNTHDAADLTKVIDDLSMLIVKGENTRLYGDDWVTFCKYQKWARPLIAWFKQLRDTIPADGVKES